MQTQHCRLWNCLLLLGLGCSDSARIDQIAARAEIPTKVNSEQDFPGEAPSPVAPDRPAAMTDEPVDRISKFGVIEKGMTRAQVEGLLKSQIDRAATVYWPGSAPIDRYYVFKDGRVMQVHFVFINKYVRAVSYVVFPLSEEQVPHWAEFDQPATYGTIW